MEGPANEPASRRRFLGVGAGTVALASASVAGCGGGQDQFAGRQSQNGGDIDIVNYALTLEYLESDFYDQVLQSGEIKGRALDVIKLIREDEHEHVKALIQAAKTLKGTPVERPSTDFSKVLQGGRGPILRTASDLENTGAGAYLGAAPNIVRADILESALAIHTIEGRHAAVLNHLVGRPFLPDGPLATPLNMDDVLPMVRRFTT